MHFEAQGFDAYVAELGNCGGVPGSCKDAETWENLPFNVWSKAGGLPVD